VTDSIETVVIPENHVAIMLTALGESPQLSQNELPKAVRQEYLRHKIIADRMNLELSDRDLLHIVCSATRSEAMPKPPSKTVARMWKDKDLKYGDPVMAKWRGEWLPCQILDAQGRNVVVRFFFAPDERNIDVAHVKELPEDYDLDEYLESLKEKG